MSIVTLLLIAEIVWVGGLCAWIISERRSPTATLAWIFALAWAPYLGVIVYLVAGPRRLHRKRRRYALARSQVARALSRPRGHGVIVPTQPSLDPRMRQLMKLVARADDAPPVRADKLDLLLTGDDCYASIEQAIAEAQQHVHLEYYIWANDRIGTHFRDLLCAKAREGVEVRLLADAIGSKSLHHSFLRPLLAAGAEVAWFNRISLKRFWPHPINFRTHRKIVVCDGRVGYTGGVNISEAHSRTAGTGRAWRDTHVRLEGAPVGWLQRAFLEDWYFATGGGPSDASYFPRVDTAPAGPWVQIIASGPDCECYGIRDLYFAAIAGARHRVLLTTPYFVPDEAILEALITAGMRGVDIRLLLSTHTDSRLVTAAAHSYYDELARADVQIYEYGPTMLHAKTLIVDDLAVVGTANVDSRSFRLNFEVIAAIYDAEIAATLADIFHADLRHAKRYSVLRGKRTPFWQRMAQSTARLLSPVL